MKKPKHNVPKHNDQFERMTNFMAFVLSEFEQIVTRIAQGNASDPQVKTDVAALKEQTTALTQTIANNDAGDAATKTAVSDLQAAITLLANKLAAAPPA